MDDPNKRPCDKPQPPEGYGNPPEGYQAKPPEGYERPKPPEGYGRPPEGYEPKPPQGYEQPKPPEGYGTPPPPPPKEYGEPSQPGYEKPQPPPPPRECGKPEKPADPCSDPNAPTPPETCDAQPFGDHIKELEKRSEEEDKNTPKGELAAYKKLSDEVWKAEKDYAKEYESLLFQELASENFFEKLRTDLLNGKITDSERKRIAEIVYCAPNVDALRSSWIAARNEIPDLQSAFAKAQNEFSDQDEIYKAALTKYQTAQKQLDAIQAQSTKEFNAKNNRAAWFLNEFEMCPGLETPPLPCEFNKWLEQVADKQAKLGEALRKAKVALEQKTAEAQKKKKDFEDAKSKRRENILKAIASDPFPTELKPQKPTSQPKPSQYQAA